MVKKIIFLSLFCSIILPAQVVSAQSANPEGTVAGQTQKDKIEDLKERIATKVAQLRVQALKPLMGEIKSVGKDNFILKTAHDEKKVLLNDETKIFRINQGRKSPIQLTNLKTGELAAAIGSTDSQGEFVAKIILAKTQPLNINGTVEKTDPANFTLSVRNAKKGLVYIVDIEGTTKIQSWVNGKSLEKAGFTKIKVGDRVHVNGTAVSDETNRISAIRVLVLPNTSVSTSAVENTTPSASPKKSSSASTPTPTP